MSRLHKRYTGTLGSDCNSENCVILPLQLEDASETLENLVYRLPQTLQVSQHTSERFRVMFVKQIALIETAVVWL